VNRRPSGVGRVALAGWRGGHRVPRGELVCREQIVFPAG